MNEIKICDRIIGNNAPPFIIAEVAQTHDGNINFAHSFIDAAAQSGVDAIKFQTHIAEAETTIEEPWRIKFSRQDESRFAYWKRMEFTQNQWKELSTHAAEHNLIFLSSPFSEEAVDLLKTIDMPAWKIASGEVNNFKLLQKVANTNKPVLISSGMSQWDEIDEAVRILHSNSCPMAIFQCTTAYPCPAEKIGLNVLSELRSRYSCPIGLSDHSATIFSGLAAVALGADLIEVHVTFHKQMFGPDVPASLTFEELKQLVQGCRFIHTSLKNPMNKTIEAENLSIMRKLFTKSIISKKLLPAGHILNHDDVTFKKPCIGLPSSSLKEYIGRKLTKDVEPNQRLLSSDFE